MDSSFSLLVLLVAGLVLTSPSCHASSLESAHSSTSPKTKGETRTASASAADASTPTPVYVPVLYRTSDDSTTPTVTASFEELKKTKEVDTMNELTDFDNSTTTITFWRPYVSYVRQVPSLLWSHFVEGMSIESLIRLNLISIGLLSIAAFTNFLMSPESDYLFERMAEVNLGTRVEEMARTVELAIDSYGKVDPEVCLRMAACTLGKQNRRSSVNPYNNSAASDVVGNRLDQQPPGPIPMPQPDSPANPATSSKDVPRDNLLFVTIQLLDKLLRSVGGKT